MANRIVVVLGEASFALYMIHHMLFRYIDEYLVGMPRPVALLTAAGGAVLLSVVVHFAIERPLRALLTDGAMRSASRLRQPDIEVVGTP